MATFPITLRCPTCKRVCSGGAWQPERRSRSVEYADWVCPLCRIPRPGPRPPRRLISKPDRDRQA